MPPGGERLHPAVVRRVNVAEFLQVGVEDDDPRAQTDRDFGGLAARHPGAQDDDGGGGDAGHATEEDAATSRSPLEVVRALLYGEPSGDLTHRREERQPAVRQPDRLVGDRGDPGGKQRRGALGGRREVEEGEEELSPAKPRVFLGDRFLHLDDEVRFRPDVVSGRHDRPAGRVVFDVWDGRTGAGVVLDENGMTGVGKFPDSDRRQRDPVLLRFDLPGHPDAHADTSTSQRPTCCRGPRSRLA